MFRLFQEAWEHTSLLLDHGMSNVRLSWLRNGLTSVGSAHCRYWWLATSAYSGNDHDGTSTRTPRIKRSRLCRLPSEVRPMLNDTINKRIASVDRTDRKKSIGDRRSVSPYDRAGPY
jgi:hypothetical protein